MPADMSKKIASETGDFLREILEDDYASAHSHKADEVAGCVFAMEMLMKLLGMSPPVSLLGELGQKTKELREVLPVEFRDREYLLVNLEAIMAEQIAKRS